MGRKKKQTPEKEESHFLPEKEMEDLNQDIEFYSANLKKDLSKMNCAAIIGILGEFLDDFIVLGHDPHGWDFVMRKVENPKDMRALNSLLSDYVNGKVKMIQRSKPIKTDESLEDFIQNYYDEDDDEEDDGDEVDY